MAGSALRSREARILQCARFGGAASGASASVRTRIRDKVNLEVLRFVRVAIGRLALGDLPKGATRSLAPEEKQALDRPSEPRASRNFD